MAVFFCTFRAGSALSNICSALSNTCFALKIPYLHFSNIYNYIILLYIYTLKCKYTYILHIYAYARTHTYAQESSFFKTGVFFALLHFAHSFLYKNNDLQSAKTISNLHFSAKQELTGYFLPIKGEQ